MAFQETFQMSGYHISWNKMIDPMQKNHPGAVCQLGLSPTDHNRLLVGFESGTLCLWDLAAKKRDSVMLNSDNEINSENKKIFAFVGISLR